MTLKVKLPCIIYDSLERVNIDFFLYVLTNKSHCMMNFLLWNTTECTKRISLEKYYFRQKKKGEMCNLFEI